MRKQSQKTLSYDVAMAFCIMRFIAIIISASVTKKELKVKLVQYSCMLPCPGNEIGLPYIHTYIVWASANHKLLTILYEWQGLHYNYDKRLSGSSLYQY